MPWLGYRRVSRVGEREKNNTFISPEDQADQIEAYADGYELEVEMLPPELDVSGSKIDRPILDQAIERIEQGDAEGLITLNWKRLSRAGHAATYKTLERLGPRLIVIEDNYKAGENNSDLIRDIRLAIARDDLETIKQQFVRVKTRSVREGIWPISKVPMGYSCTRKKDGGDGKLYTSEDAKKVRKAFKAKAAGKSWKDVADILGNGISAAYNIIENPVYLGETRLLVNGDHLSEQTHQAIVDRATWEAAQPQRRGRKVPKDNPGLLAGLTRCAACSRTMSLSSFTNGNFSYRCHARYTGGGECERPAIISRNVIEPYVEEIVLPWLESVYVESRPKTDHLAEALEELESAEAELKNYQLATKGLPADELRAGLESNIAAVESAREKVSEVQRGSKAVPVVADSGSLADAWPKMSVPERNLMLKAALGVVWVSKGKASVPVADRVRVIERGCEPERLSRSGHGGNVPLTAVPDGKLKGQIGTLLG